jgi:hypothetical protein
VTNLERFERPLAHCLRTLLSSLNFALMV